MNTMGSIFWINIGKALLFTIIIELIVIFILREKNKRVYLGAILINMVTNVAMNLIIQIIPVDSYAIWVLGMEALIVFIEFLVYYWILKDTKRAFALSLLCNASSYSLGLWLMPWLY